MQYFVDFQKKKMWSLPVWFSNRILIALVYFRNFSQLNDWVVYLLYSFMMESLPVVCDLKIFLLAVLARQSLVRILVCCPVLTYPPLGSITSIWNQRPQYNLLD